MAGVEQFLIVVGWRAEVVRQTFGDGARFGVMIRYAIRWCKDGTGRVVELARDSWRRFVCLELRRHPCLSRELSRLTTLEPDTEALVTVKPSKT